MQSRKFPVLAKKEEMAAFHWTHLVVSLFLCYLRSRSSTFHSGSFRFYPYILITSAVFLLLTLIVYSFWSRLLNPYTRLMRHFALSMMLAFILLSVNQMVAFGDISSAVCAINGWRFILVRHDSSDSELITIDAWYCLIYWQVGHLGLVTTGCLALKAKEVWKGKFQYSWPPCPFWFGISYISEWNFLFNFKTT